MEWNEWKGTNGMMASISRDDDDDDDDDVGGGGGGGGGGHDDDNPASPNQLATMSRQRSACAPNEKDTSTILAIT